MLKIREIGVAPEASCAASGYSLEAGGAKSIARLQIVTLVWMLVECGVALFGARRAHSPALLAFGSDSLVELLSAAVVLLQVTPSFPLCRKTATRIAGILLFLLAAVVAFASIGGLVMKAKPHPSFAGIAITVAALIAMPILAAKKRRLARETNNPALAADAVQSATCAYLAAITLAGLTINALFGISWIDSAAALVAIPILIVEGRRAMRGEECGCC